jgi:hypothetical protein
MLTEGADDVLLQLRKPGVSEPAMPLFYLRVFNVLRVFFLYLSAYIVA